MNCCAKLALFLTLISSTARAFDYCTQKCHNGKVNSMCKNNCKNKACNAVQITDEFRQTMLDTHNAYRNDVALGNVKEGQLSTTVANMRVMQYDKELEVSIKCNIVTNGFNHDDCRGSEHFFPQGQNLYQKKTTGSKLTVDQVGKSAVEEWFKEVKSVQNAKIYDEFESVPGTGHFTQVIWANSYVLGCSACEHKDGQWKVTIIGCNYYKVGNMIGAPIFKKGDPASECGDLHPNSKYKGLCGETKPASGAHRQLLLNMMLVKMTVVVTIIMPVHSKLLL